MSPLRETLDEYLAMRRALGHKLCRAGRLLQQFVAFADLAGATYVTTDLALAWVGQPCGAALAERARRLGIVRRFAQYCGALRLANHRAAARPASASLSASDALYLS